MQMIKSYINNKRDGEFFKITANIAILLKGKKTKASELFTFHYIILIEFLIFYFYFI